MYKQLLQSNTTVIIGAQDTHRVTCIECVGDCETDDASGDAGLARSHSEHCGREEHTEADTVQMNAQPTAAALSRVNEHIALVASSCRFGNELRLCTERQNCAAPCNEIILCKYCTFL